MLGERSKNKWSQSVLCYRVDSEKCLPGEAFVWIHAQLVHTCFLTIKITISRAVSLEPLKKGETRIVFLRGILQDGAAPALLLKFCLPWSQRVPGPQLQGQRWWGKEGSPWRPSICNCPEPAWWPLWSRVPSREPCPWAFSTADGSPAQGLITSRQGGSQGSFLFFLSVWVSRPPLSLGGRGAKARFLFKKKRKMFSQLTAVCKQ